MFECFKKEKDKKEDSKHNDIIVERSLVSYLIELLISSDDNNELKMAVKKVDKKTTEKDKPIIFVAFTNSEIQKVLSDWYHSAKLHKEENLSNAAYENILKEIHKKYIKEYTSEEFLVREFEILHKKIIEYFNTNNKKE